MSGNPLNGRKVVEAEATEFVEVSDELLGGKADLAAAWECVPGGPKYAMRRESGGDMLKRGRCLKGNLKR